MRQGKIKTGAINLPVIDGLADQTIKTNGSGILSFATPSVGAMSLITAHVVTESENVYSFSGLNGDADGLYVIYGMLKINDNLDSVLTLNNDTLGTNYVGSLVLSGVKLTEASFNQTNEWTSFYILVYCSPWANLGYSYVKSFCASNISGGVHSPKEVQSQVCYVPTDNITSIQIRNGAYWNSGTIKLFKIG